MMVKPTPPQIAWHDMELGMFFHFDISVYESNSFEKLSDPEIYQPKALDTDQWMKAAKAMGANYAIFVAKHVTGFLQWQSDLYPFGVKQSSWRDGKGDLVEEFVKSCRKYGIKPGIYASMDKNYFLNVQKKQVNQGEGGDPKAQAEYNRICEKMAEELWSRYGDLVEIWFDGGVAETGGPNLLPILMKHQPNAVTFQGPAAAPHNIRWIGNERGVAPYPCWSTTRRPTSDDGTRERKLKLHRGYPDAPSWIPAECDVPIRHHEWFWGPNREDRLYSLEQLMDMYYKSVGRNCNLLLNANPNRDGLIPEADMKRYIEFGNEIKRRFSRSVATISGKGETLELPLETPSEINHVIIMEDIAQGERIRSYVVEGLGKDGTWIKLCEGESVGHKRIQRFETIPLEKIRLRVTKSASEPVIRELSVYNVR